MMKCVYAHTGFSSTYPSYVNISSEGDETCGLKVTVRDHARMVQTENGAHFDAGFTSETLLSREHALDLARSIQKHYGAEPYGYEHPKPGEDGIGEAARRRFFPDDHITGETSRVYEETESVGELSHTRRLVIESMADGEPLNAQVARLAGFILQNFDGEPSENAGAIDTAIRLLGDYAALLNIRKVLDDSKERASRAKIAEGLRAGQAEHSDLEGADHTYQPFGFVAVGEHASHLETRDPFEAVKPPLVIPAAHPDGGNEPAKSSLPLGAQVFPDERAYSAPPRNDGAFDVVSPQPSVEDALANSEHLRPQQPGDEDDMIPF